MAKYTIELRKIVKDIDIFSFDYDLYNNDLKQQFQKKFINHFYYREIGVETIGRFLINLETKINEIMPYYTELYKTSIYEYNPILNYDLTEEINRNLDTLSNGTISGNNKNTQYDTPITPIEHTRKTPSFIDESTGINENNNKSNTVEYHKRNTRGNIGVMSTQDLIMKERQIIINIDKMIFDDCEDLFMQVF